MAAQKAKQKTRKKTKETIPFGRENYIIFFIGILVIVLGYIFLAQGPADSFWSLTLAPILLVISYCIIVPIAIIYRKKTEKKEPEQPN
jgi:amino acid transporter